MSIPKLQKLILVVGDVVLILLATQLAPMIRFGRTFNIFDIHTGASTFTFVLYVVSFYIVDLYNMETNSKYGETIMRSAIAVIGAGVFAPFLFYFFPQWKYGRGIFLIQMVLVWVFSGLWRIIFSALYPIAAKKENVIIIGTNSCGKSIAEELEQDFSPYHVVGFIDDNVSEKQEKAQDSFKLLGKTDQLIEIAEKEGVKTAVLAMPDNRSSRLISHILNARLKGIEVLEMATVFEKLTGRVPVAYVSDEWLLFADGFYLISKQHVQRIKRLIDLGVSSLIFLLTMPVMVLTGIAIKLESAGPVLFKQGRVGMGGSVFTLYKFRSMRTDAEKNGPVWAGKKDNRVTRVGKWIRKFRIDELPQIWNVFRGDMSLIGPRPERPEFVKDLEAKIPYYGVRHSVRPGITGWAQIKYPYGASVEDALRKLEYDLYYIKNMSLFLDLKILLRTIGVIILGEGAR